MSSLSTLEGSLPTASRRLRQHSAENRYTQTHGSFHSHYVHEGETMAKPKRPANACHGEDLTVRFVSLLTLEHDHQVLLLQVFFFRDDRSDGGQRFAGLPHGPGIRLSADMLPVVIGGGTRHAFGAGGVELDVEVGASAGGDLGIAVVNDYKSVLVLAHYTCTRKEGGRAQGTKQGKSI